MPENSGQSHLKSAIKSVLINTLARQLNNYKKLNCLHQKTFFRKRFYMNKTVTEVVYI